MRTNKRIYLVEEDLRYYRDRFNSLGPDDSAFADADFLAEFIRYVDFIEKEFSYQIQVANFPQVFMTKLVKV